MASLDASTVLAAGALAISAIVLLQYRAGSPEAPPPRRARPPPSPPAEAPPPAKKEKVDPPASYFAPPLSSYVRLPEDYLPVVPATVKLQLEPSLSAATTGYVQAGYMTSANRPVLPIYARPSISRRGRYHYYTVVDDVRLPIYSTKKDCMEEIACDELFDDSEVAVPDYDPAVVWKVKMYQKYGGYRLY